MRQMTVAGAFIVVLAVITQLVLFAGYDAGNEECLTIARKMVTLHFTETDAGQFRDMFCSYQLFGLREARPHFFYRRFLEHRFPLEDGEFLFLCKSGKCLKLK